MACAKDLEGGPRRNYCYQCHRFDGVRWPSLVFTGVSGFNQYSKTEGLIFLKPSQVCTCSYCHQLVTDQCYSVHYLSAENGQEILLGYICHQHAKELDLQKILFENYAEKMRQLVEVTLEKVDINNEKI